MQVALDVPQLSGNHDPMVSEETAPLPKWSVDDVRKKGRALEGAVLSRALQLYLNNEVVVIDGKVVFKPGMRTLLQDFGGDLQPAL